MSSQNYDLRMRGVVGAQTTNPLGMTLPEENHPYHHWDQVASRVWTVGGEGYGPAGMDRTHLSMPNQLPALGVDSLPWWSASMVSSSAVSEANLIAPVQYHNSLPSTAASMGNVSVAGVEGAGGLLDVDYSQPRVQSTSQVYPEIDRRALEAARFICGWGGCSYHGWFLCKQDLWRHIQDEHLISANSNAIGASNFVSLAGYGDSYPSRMLFIGHDSGMGLEGASGFIGVNYLQPGSQSTMEMNPEVYFSAQRTAHFRCGWEGCGNRSGYGRKTTLWRHIQDKHVDPGLYQCNDCWRIFGRKDNLTSHTRAVHRRQPSSRELVKLGTTPSLPL